MKKNALGRVNMKLFTKLALVSAVAVSSNAMAMQAMDDAALSSTTGQDGISIGIGIADVAIQKVHVFDGDGLKAAQALPDGKTGADYGGTGAAGAITINNIHITPGTDLLASHNLADVAIDTDGNGGNPFLNINAAVSGLKIDLGKIEVNDASGTAGAYVAGTGSATILNSLSLETGKTSANIQLGNTPQGAMIKLGGQMTGGLTISNLSLHDASANGGGDIVIGSIKLNDNGQTYLSTDADIAVKTSGLAVTAMKASTDVYVKGIQLGSSTASSIGDIAVKGMAVQHLDATSGTLAPGALITISGH